MAKEKLEKDVAIGTVGVVSLKFTGGKAVVTATIGDSVLDGDVVASATATVTADAGAFIDMIFAKIEAASPAGTVPIEETVKMVVKNAVLAIQ